ncbi:hypothetical protein ACVPOY_02850 [Staphylococcus aureus]
MLTKLKHYQKLVKKSIHRYNCISLVSLALGAALLAGRRREL